MSTEDKLRAALIDRAVTLQDSQRGYYGFACLMCGAGENDVRKAEDLTHDARCVLALPATPPGLWLSEPERAQVVEALEARRVASVSAKAALAILRRKP